MKETFPMIEPSLEKAGWNIAGGAAELVAAIPPGVWAVLAGYILIRWAWPKKKQA